MIQLFQRTPPPPTMHYSERYFLGIVLRLSRRLQQPQNLRKKDLHENTHRTSDCCEVRSWIFQVNNCVYPWGRLDYICNAKTTKSISVVFWKLI